MSYHSQMMDPETVNIDAVSELDEALVDPLTEAKFQGLKRLNAKKVAKLMAQIDLNQNEIIDMKVEGKDNVRTRIIQGLKKKIGYHDVVIDYLKREFLPAVENGGPVIEKADYYKLLADIDETVMRKTIGGPKRFRPVGRVQIEKKISELEKKIKGFKIAKEANKEKVIGKPREGGYNQGPDAEEKTAKILRIKQSEENADYQRNFEANNKKIEYLTELLQNLRNRSSQQSHSRKSVSNMITEDEYNKMRAHNDDMSVQLERSFADLAVTEEEVIQCKTDSAMALEHLQLEHDRIVSLTQKSSRQNESILRRMADLETELDSVLNGASGEGLTTAAFNRAPVNSNSAAIRCQTLKNEIKKEQDACTELEKGVEVANNLKEAIRLKNDEVRELKRSMHELSRLDNKTPDVTERY